MSRQFRLNIVSLENYKILNILIACMLPYVPNTQSACTILSYLACL